MKLVIDAQEYTFKQGMSKRIGEIYTRIMQKEKIILNFKGKAIDFSRKSVARVGVKTLIAPFILGILQEMYKEKGLSLPEHNRKNKEIDFIDYVILCFIKYMSYMEKELTFYVKTSQDSNNCSKVIESISTNGTIQATREQSERSVTTIN